MYTFQAKYNRRVYVTFQSKACCDDLMQQWINELWKPNCSAEEVLLTLDCHKIQKMNVNEDLLYLNCGICATRIHKSSTTS